ncbi:hypothetical protein [Dyadobacter soli]|nr:hypothetical protein [Dyadobacter soli]
MLQLNLEYEGTENSGLSQAQRSPQEQFEEIFSEEIPVIAEIFRNAFDAAMRDLARNSNHYQTPTSKANRTIEYIRGMLFDAFPALMGTRGSRFYLEKGGYRIYFKKLNRDLRPMNNPTMSSNQILNQTSLFPEFRLSEVFIGYQLNRAKDEITGIFAVYFVQGSHAWVSRLDTIPGSNTVPVSNAQNAPVDEDDLVVRPRSRPDESSAAM